MARFSVGHIDLLWSLCYVVDVLEKRIRVIRPLPLNLVESPSLESHILNLETSFLIKPDL